MYFESIIITSNTYFKREMRNDLGYNNKTD